MARDAWFSRLGNVRIDQFVFIDELGANTKMQRTHSRVLPGQRVISRAPHGHWKNVSTISAMTTAGIIASASFDGATDTAMFVTFVREALVPVLGPGQVVVLDNLRPHLDPAVEALIRSAGARLIPLPPYSPDLNPIEMVISKIKSALQDAAEREVGELYAAIGRAVASIIPQDAWNYMRHCGYSIR